MLFLAVHVLTGLVALLPWSVPGVLDRYPWLPAVGLALAVLLVPAVLTRAVALGLRVRGARRCRARCRRATWSCPSPG